MKTIPVRIGSVTIGAGHPIAIQSMTNTPTADVVATVEQIKALADAGSELVRITVNSPEAAKAVSKIKEELTAQGYGDLPIIGDFHYNGHLLLRDFPNCAKALDKYRINPGNLGLGKNHDLNFRTFIETALHYDKPVRIGVNWGSLDKALLTILMDLNGKKKKPKTDREVIIDAMVESGIQSALFALSLGLPEEKIVLSVKMSRVQDMITAYEKLWKRLQRMKKPFPLHLGLTEAGSGMQGIISSAAALSVLLNKGIGDTIRKSLTPAPDQPRTAEVEACKLLLQTLGIRSFQPLISSCPGCGRTKSSFYQELAQKVSQHVQKNLKDWRRKYPGVENLTIAVMGCVVNGPGESQHADIGISLPGDMEDPVAHVFQDGKPFSVVKGENIAQEFLKILDEYIKGRYDVEK